jgi:hypothetical protein
LSTITPNRFQRFLIKRVGVDKYIEEWEKSKNFYNELKVDDSSDFELKENKTWYDGGTQKLEFFYKEHRGPYMINQYKFWHVINTTMPRIHYPLASTITNSMGTLLFNQEIEFTVDAGAKSRNASIQTRLDEILEVNDIQVLLQEAARMQSYSGSVALKLNYDDTIADLPLITMYPKEAFNVHRVYNQIIYIDFNDFYGKEYKLVSRYGRGYINYMLYKGKQKVPLSDCEETKGLKDIAFFDAEGLIHTDIFATVIGNKTKQGISDYKDLVDTFHALDETYSTLITYIRRTKPNIFITEDIAKKDKNGKPLPLNEFDNIITVLDQAIGDDGTKVERSIEEIKVAGYIEMLDKLRFTVLEKIGISPATIGIDAAGAAASGEALRLRERLSIKTRGEKLALWDESLEAFLVSIYNFDILVKGTEEPKEGIRVYDEVVDFNISINFGEYIKETLDERVKIYLVLFEKGAISLNFLQTQLFGKELSEEELEALLTETKADKAAAMPQIEPKKEDEEDEDSQK